MPAVDRGPENYLRLEVALDLNPEPGSGPRCRRLQEALEDAQLAAEDLDRALEQVIVLLARMSPAERGWRLPKRRLSRIRAALECAASSCAAAEAVLDGHKLMV